MTVDLALFAVQAATKTDRVPAGPDADAAFHALANALLAVLGHAEDCDRATRKAARISARLDDPAVQGTPEQRAAAEAAHWSCVQTAKRERDAVRRQARAVARLWGQAPEAARADVLATFPGGWHASPCWELLRTDQTIAPLEPWDALIRARDAWQAPSFAEVPF